MKMIDALETLKTKGITNLTGMVGQTDINVYIENARKGDENATDVLSRYPDMSWAIYHVDHINDHYIVEINGYHIIVTKYDNHDMPTYSDYGTNEEMYVAYKEWRIMRDANSIADEMTAKRPGELPRAAWLLIAASELKVADKAATKAFEREYGDSSH